MVNPQASSSEKEVTSRYWAGVSPTTTLRGKSVPALGSKRAAPECDDSTGLAAEHLRRKHAKTFDFKPAHDDEVEVKDEPASTQPPSDLPLSLTDLPQSKLIQSTTDLSVPIEPLPPTITAPAHPPSSTVPVKPLPPSPPVEPSYSTYLAKSSSSVATAKPTCKYSDSGPSIQCQKPPTRLRNPREEETVIATLAHICDESVTEATVNLVLRWAREAPNPSGERDDLGITYLEGILARIDKHGIEPLRREVVVDLLCSRYIRHLEDLKARIGTLSAPQLPLSPPSGVDRSVEPRGDAHDNDHPIEVLAFCSSASQGDDGYIAQSGLRHRLEQQMAGAEAVDVDQDTQPSPAKSLASTTTVAMLKKPTLPKQPLDVFQEAALAARNFATEEKGELPEFQRHIKSVWRRVQSCRREEWDELLRIRKTCTGVSTKSRRLLESQGLLMDFVPDYRLHTQPPHPHGIGPLATGSDGPSVGAEQSVNPSLSKVPGNRVLALH